MKNPYPRHRLYLALLATAAPALMFVAPARADYQTTVLADKPLAYYPLNESTPWTPNVATNSGSLGSAGNAVGFAGEIFKEPGAIVGDPDTAIRFSAIDTNSDDGGVPTVIPYVAALNASGSFSVEAWLRPTEEGAGNAQCPLFNCQASTEDFGWDCYQRASTMGTGQQGFEFYMNDNNGNRVGDAVGGSYTIGQWCHLVAVYDSTAATLTLYINGVPVAQSTGVSGYVPNPSYPMSIGGYWDGTQNPFVGDIDEFAVYTSALSAAQVLAHYQNGTNASRATPYPSLIISDGAAEYLRLDQPANDVAANLGTLGAAANGIYSYTTNGVAGPRPPVYPGFELSNLAADFNGTNSYVELVNPDGLNFTNEITLEAWVQPNTNDIDGATADVISHGIDDAEANGVSLQLVNVSGGAGSATYQIGSVVSGTATSASFTIPAADLSGTNWVYLAGTYDGTNWNIYRNGVLDGSQPGTGSIAISNTWWAIGARGRWKHQPGYPTSGLELQFAGGIDGAAIYNYSLSPAQIAAHYSAGVQGNSELTASRSGSNLILTWPTGTLQSASTVAGPYTDLGTATSPYSVPLNSATQMFYRLKF
ncbi:MAG: LamG domain-containing protein [Verrucomicrobiota bacterium]